MLSSLSIADVVLIDHLELDIRPGLCVLTGETGAGKSILLDALGLALGERAEARLVRRSAKQAAVTAVFHLDDDHPVRDHLAEQGIVLDDGELLLRRVLGADGRSRAFINDQPVSIGLLKTIGGLLVEIHGQFESQRLLNPASHQGLLDAFGGYTPLRQETARMHQVWKKAVQAHGVAEEKMAAARRDEEYLRHAVGELTTLTPEAGEETRLAEQRTLMMHGEQLVEAMNNAARDLGEGRGAEDQLRSAIRELERASEKAGGRLDEVIATLDRAASEATEGLAQLEKLSGELSFDPAALEQAEERLFALRALSRKHGVAVDDLSALCDQLADRLAALEDGGAALADLEQARDAARSAYEDAAGRLSDARKKAAKGLDPAINGELSALKLGQAVFVTEIAPLAEDSWNETGRDRVSFTAATNPGTPAGPLNKIASGGELARFMLAIKVVLADADPIATVVFDEVDAGVGGAVADAVGERLARLSKNSQVLVVTHSPQVAARGVHHWRVTKSLKNGEKGTGLKDEVEARTGVDVLDETARKEEIARMLAGAKITDEARAAADSLLAGAAE
jgi:DNA repair protein RecN (Recombination protein N)